jgi:4,5-dihydroxyphthalate decarboxylase
MPELKLTFACGGYDRMEALRSGRVKPEGIDLETVQIDDPRHFFDVMMAKSFAWTFSMPLR